MKVTVEPSIFSIVKYDADEIAVVAKEMLTLLGMESTNLTIEVDETVAMSRVTTTMGDPVHVLAMSAAFENLKKPMTFSADNTKFSLGRALLRVRDRLTPNFSDAPADEDLSIVEAATWDTYCVGRLSRLGLKVHKQRWHYNFRNRHGFNDATDKHFATIWESDDLTWSQLTEISRHAIA